MKYIVNRINNIQNYQPIFRDTLCCLGSYTCTVVLEAGNRVCNWMVSMRTISWTRRAKQSTLSTGKEEQVHDKCREEYEYTTTVLSIRIEQQNDNTKWQLYLIVFGKLGFFGYIFMWFDSMNKFIRLSTECSVCHSQETKSYYHPFNFRCSLAEKPTA